MTNSGNPGKDGFIAELRAFHQACGCPSYRRLARISEDLHELYRSPGGVGYNLTRLTLASTSEILAGKRKGLPGFDWVASFVLSCQRWAFDQHAIRYDPGIASLPEWARRLAAYAAGPGSPAGQGEPGGEGAPSSIGRLSQQQQAFIIGHGRYGTVLLSQATQGLPDALYRIALLLATDQLRGDDALALMLAAAAAGSAPAIDLLDANPEQLPPVAAARHADALARTADACGSSDEALAFYRAAARGGIPDAAIKHAQAVLAGHGDAEAATWLAALASQPSGGRHSTEPT